MHCPNFGVQHSESTFEYINQLPGVTLTLPEYRSLIAAVEKSSGVAASNAGLALYYSFYSKNETRTSGNPLVSYLGVKLQSKDFLLKLAQTALWDIGVYFPNFTDKRLLDDAVFVGNLLQNYRFSSLLKMIPKEFFLDEKRVLSIAAHVDACLKYCPPRLAENREFVKNMVEANPLNWFSVQPQFLDDEEIALLAMRWKDYEGQASEAFQHSSDRLKSDRAFVTKALELGLSLALIPKKFASDIPLIKTTIMKRPSELENAPEVVKDDRPFVFELADKNGYDAFCYASQRLLADRDLAFKSVQGAPEAFSCASDTLRDDKTLAMATLSKGVVSFSFVHALSPRLKDDEELVRAAIDRCEDEEKAYCLAYASERLQEKLRGLVESKGLK